MKLMLFIFSLILFINNVKGEVTCQKTLSDGVLIQQDLTSCPKGYDQIGSGSSFYLTDMRNVQTVYYDMYGYLNFKLYLGSSNSYLYANKMVFTKKYSSTNLNMRYIYFQYLVLQTHTPKPEHLFLLIL